MDNGKYVLNHVVVIAVGDILKNNSIVVHYVVADLQRTKTRKRMVFFSVGAGAAAAAAVALGLVHTPSVWGLNMTKLIL